MAAKDRKDAPKAEKKDATLIIKAHLDCQGCYKKVWKILRKLREKEKIQLATSSFEDKNKTVTISGPFDPEVVMQKIKCMACKCNVILDVQVKPDPPPPPAPATPAPAAKTPTPTPTPEPKLPVCDRDKQLTVKVEPKISVGAAACCHHAPVGYHHGGCKSSSSCGGASAEHSCRCSSGASSCDKAHEFRCDSSTCSCGNVSEGCCGTTRHHVCFCGKNSGGCPSGAHIAVCGQPPCKLLFEDNVNPTCRVM